MTRHTHHLRAQRARLGRGLAPVLAASLVGAWAVVGLPAAAQAADDPARTTTEQPAFSGYVASAWAAPVKIEIYEPSIPIPADPQLEIEMGYSVVKADTSSAKGRGSWLWPGDPIGDGLKTIVEQMGLPPQLGANGYPVQVNSSWPGEETSAKDEPMPGMVMRTGAGERETFAEVGFSPDSDIADLPGETPAPSASPSAPTGLLGLPGLPSLPFLGPVVDLGALPVISDLAALGESMTQGGTIDPSSPGIPPQLAGIVDFSGYSSSSRTFTSPERIRTVAQSALGDVRLLGGLVRLEGITTTQESVSNGRTARSTGTSTVGALVVLGQKFAWTDQGFEVAGVRVPGVPADAFKALEMLGVTLTMPKVTAEDEGLKASGLAEGLKVEIDASILAKALRILPLQQIIDLVPEEAKELKSVASLLTGLSPRTVVTLGNAGTATETVTALAPGPVPDGPATTAPADPGGPSDPAPTDPGGEPTQAPPVDPGSGTPPGGGSPDTGAPADAGLPEVSAPGAPTDEITDAAPQVAGVTQVAPMGAGLPPLASVPGFLTILALALAGAGGIYLRRAGLLALGTGASCTHGLDSGLPDLRKA